MAELPQCIADALHSHHIDTDSILAFVACDEARDGGFAENCLLFDSENLYILAGNNKAEQKDYRGYFSKRGAPFAPPRAGYSLKTFPISEIEGVSVSNLVSGGVILLRRDGRGEAVSMLSAGVLSRAARFASLFAKLKEKGGLAPEDLMTEEEETTCPRCGMAYVEPERKICPRCTKKRSVFVRLCRMMLRYKGPTALMLVLMAVSSALGLAGPYLQGHVLFDWALGPKTGSVRGVLLTLGLMLLFQLLSVLAGAGLGVVNAKLAATVMKNIRVDVFAAMQRLSLSFFQRRQTGQLMTRVNNDSADLQHFFIDGMPYLIVNGLNFIGILAVMLTLNWKLTLLSMIPLPGLVLFVFKVFPRLYRLNWFKFARRSRLTGIISDTFKGSRVVRAFGMGPREIKRFGAANSSFYSAECEQQQMVSTVFPLMSLIMQLGGYVIWVYGGWQVMFGRFSFGSLMTFLNYIFMIYGPVQFLCNIADWWSSSMAAAQRIFEITDAVPEVKEKPDAFSVGRLNGDIEIDNITFGYEPNKPVLHHVSARVKPGTMVGVVGHSGAGKSTLVNLVTRLYDVSDGTIRLDGRDVRDIKMADLRRNIGIVSQEVYVFSGTVSENIAYGNPGCSKEEIMAAARIANAHDFIEKLPEGYDTVVGTGGHDLSGGEKQRISIARAILQNPRILILDEATASLDTQTERQIQAALEELIRGRTTIAIAHRLSTLRNADQLLVLENGEVCESGTHAELVKRKGIYFNLFKKQNEALSIKAIED